MVTMEDKIPFKRFARSWSGKVRYASFPLKLTSEYFSLNKDDPEGRISQHKKAMSIQIHAYI